MKTSETRPQPRGSAPPARRINETDAALAGFAEVARIQAEEANPVAVIRRAPPASMSLDAVPSCNDPNASGTSRTYPVAVIEPDRVVIYTGRDNTGRRSIAQRQAEKHLRQGTYKGYISPGTRSRIRKTLTTWLKGIQWYRSGIKSRWESGRAYPVFATLTLPGEQLHSDREINRKCLQPFLIRLRREFGIRHYFWRAEAQDRGAIHYHLLLDRHVPARLLQMYWNMSTNALGYLDRYVVETGSFMPPSTDVIGVREVIRDAATGKERRVDPVGYLLKYVLKVPKAGDQEGEEGQEGGDLLDGQGRKTRPIEGRVWGMSDGLRDLQAPRAEATLRVINAMEEAVDQGEVRKVAREHAVIYYGRAHKVLGRAAPGIWKLLQAYHLQAFATLYPDHIPRGHELHGCSIDLGNTWLDLESWCLYERAGAEDLGKSFATAAEAEAWINDRKRKRA